MCPPCFVSFQVSHSQHWRRRRRLSHAQGRDDCHMSTGRLLLRMFFASDLSDKSLGQAYRRFFERGTSSRRALSRRCYGRDFAVRLTILHIRTRNALQITQIRRPSSPERCSARRSVCASGRPWTYRRTCYQCSVMCLSTYRSLRCSWLCFGCAPELKASTD